MAQPLNGLEQGVYPINKQIFIPISTLGINLTTASVWALSPLPGYTTFTGLLLGASQNAQLLSIQIPINNFRPNDSVGVGVKAVDLQTLTGVPFAPGSSKGDTIQSIDVIYTIAGAAATALSAVVAALTFGSFSQTTASAPTQSTLVPATALPVALPAAQSYYRYRLTPAKTLQYLGAASILEVLLTGTTPAGSSILVVGVILNLNSEK